jgi:sulfite oxidase
MPAPDLAPLSDASRFSDDALLVHQLHPLNAEPLPERLATAPVTPLGTFYLRNHGDIPRLDAAGFRVRVEGRVARGLELTVAELRDRFPRSSVVATLQCAGNRRGELAALAPVDGFGWRNGAIGTAEWSGVALADVLRAAGCEPDPGRHVAFEAADTVVLGERRFTYGGSITLDKALRPEVLLAFEMNGQPLPAEHGAPLRVVVPGQIGARSVKWLTAIRVQDEPSENHYQRREYKLLPPHMHAGNADWEAGLMLQDMPVNAAICAPENGTELAAGVVELRGYAIAGGRAIARVEVTADGGRNWHAADLAGNSGNPWAWTLWRAALALPEGAHEIAVRAWDAAAQTQPERLESVWNWKGYMNTAWHRIGISCR